MENAVVLLLAAAAAFDLQLTNWISFTTNRIESNIFRICLRTDMNEMIRTSNKTFWRVGKPLVE